MRVFCISDIHGRINAFKELLNKLSHIDHNYQFRLLGDYIDRGFNSYEVVELVMELWRKGAKVLKGNHEDMFIKWLNNQWDTQGYFKNGGYQTIISYGYNPTGENLDWIKSDFKKKYYRHYLFLKQLPLYYEEEKYVYVHAGVDPFRLDWKMTEPQDFLWDRVSFYKQKNDYPNIFIFGHTATHKLGMEDNDIWFGHNMIGIDGGASFGYGYNLNCLEIHKEKYKEHSVKIKG